MNRLLTVEEVAQLFNCSLDRIYNLTRENILPVCRLGRQIRFSEEAITEFISNGGKALPGGWKRNT